MEIKAKNLNNMQQIFKVAVFTGVFGFYAYRFATYSGTFTQSVVCAIPYAC